MIISSQRFLGEDATAEKRAARDYLVTVSPEFTYAGGQYRVVLDGHHSLAAAKADGVEPEYVEATAQTCDHVALLDAGDVETFLAATWIDSDYYNILDVIDVW